MLSSISQRLLTLFQLTRMALVFTAIADALCSVFLRAASQTPPGQSIWNSVSIAQIFAVVGISAGLYGFGMSLNDIIDRRRDSQIAPGRPLPSGRVGLAAAHVVCGGLLLIAIACSVIYSLHIGSWISALLLLWTAALIAFYDLAGKYLVAAGLISLGLIRYFHAFIPAPYIPLLWHPLLLLNHVAILSAVAYHWEEKRPALTRAHWLVFAGGLLAVNGTAIGFVLARHEAGTPALRIGWEILVPLAAIIAFIGLAAYIRQRAGTSREAGQMLMLYGLLWLIVYDACFTAVYTRNALATAIVLLLLPTAYFSVRIMRWWAKLATISQKPQFKRARA